MTNNPIERKIAHSFKLVKHDIERLGQALNNFGQRLSVIEDRLAPKESHSMIISTIKSKPSRKAKKKGKRK